ncbi:MAG: PqqD family protein [Actinobacteria bacterium]|nr:PqqD family protein [Actinomycetota bacterium]NIS35117.1 PqqD family protein [Actinomycetota bacterium]NIT96018.1 PqqD family protein [Actinomycetota bacterium]NIU19698.1 PqqD family protein [Actinomycetota bacterium]NIU67094.1 PqqD family protein [Actinomycetota bacterium]
MTISADTVVGRADVVWRRTFDRVLVRVPGEGVVVELAGTAVALWDRVEQPCRFDDLCAELAGRHGADLGTVTADVAAAVGELTAGGVLDGG